MARIKLIFVFAIFAIVMLAATSSFACPTCKEGMEHDPAAMSMARGYFWSILFMMSMPFVILGSLGCYFYVEIRKARRQLASQPLNEPLS